MGLPRQTEKFTCAASIRLCNDPGYGTSGFSKCTREVGKQQNQGQDDSYTRDGPRKENRQLAVRHDQRLAKGLFQHGAENERQEQGRCFVVEFSQDVPRDPRGKHDEDVKDTVPNAVTADQAE